MDISGSTTENQPGIETAAALARLGSAINYLATPAVSSYFDAREHEAYYCALKRAGPRRDFHPQLLPVLERFFSDTESESGSAAVDRAMAAGRGKRRRGARSDVSAVASAVHPHGMTLLSPASPITYDNLKTAYRAAARRHHPDVGGTHEAMIAINEAFSFAHNLLLEEHVASSGDGDDEFGLRGAEPHACIDYRYACAALLLRCYLDDWDLETALQWLHRLTSAAWQTSAYAQDPWQKIAVIEPAGKLASRLAVAGLRTEAHWALDVAREYLGVAKAHGLFYEPFVDEPASVVTGAKRPVITITHPRQAENALRLGVIDDKRYRNVLKKARSDAGSRGMAEEMLRSAKASGVFIAELPTDHVVRGKVASRPLVPEPDYYITRIADLTDDQQAEYAKAFQSDGRLTLILKYVFVRLVSLLESAVLHPTRVDTAAAEREARFLGELQRAAGGKDAYARIVADALATFRNEATDVRLQRADILNDIVSGDVRASGMAVDGFSDSPLGTALTERYMRLILRPIKDLKHLRSRGKLPESEDERLDRESFLPDRAALNDPSITQSRAEAIDAAKVAKVEPETAVKIYEQHCQRLLAIGDSLRHVEWLDIGYWIDKLTATLVRLKRWGAAEEWLGRYFDLPERYRRRSSESQEKRLQKRLQRCRDRT